MRGLDDFEVPIESAATSAFSYGIGAALPIVIPGIGLLIGFALNKLWGDDNDWREVAAHFTNNVMAPVLNAVKAKDYMNIVAIDLFTNATRPEPFEHLGYVYQNYPNVMPAYYALAMGNALARMNPDRLMRLAAIIDIFERAIESNLKFSTPDVQDAPEPTAVEAAASYAESGGGSD